MCAHRASPRRPACVAQGEVLRNVNSTWVCANSEASKAQDGFCHLLRHVLRDLTPSRKRHPPTTSGRKQILLPT